MRVIPSVSIHAPAWGATKALERIARIAAFQSTLPRGERPQAGLSYRQSSTFQSTLPRGERRRGFGGSHFRFQMFQSTLPRGERPTGCHVSSERLKFQSTLPRGERPRPLPAGSRHGSRFNPRSRVGSDCSVMLQRLVREVSIHAPAWGATRVAAAGGADGCRFNPRSRVGSDSESEARQCPAAVSIHAPAWGATPKHPGPHRRRNVSIHAPAWGATQVQPLNQFLRVFQSTLPRGERRRTTPRCSELHQGFNPRSRVGSDTPLAGVSSWVEVSIHAPAWGATMASMAVW